MIVTFEEGKEADSSTRQAFHLISRGNHGKGHFFSRNLNSEGRVDTMQTLHNIKKKLALLNYQPPSFIQRSLHHFHPSLSLRKYNTFHLDHPS